MNFLSIVSSDREAKIIRLNQLYVLDKWSNTWNLNSYSHGREQVSEKSL